MRIYDNFSRGTCENLKEALEDARCEIFADGGDIQHKDILLKAMKGMDGVFTLLHSGCWSVMSIHVRHLI